MKMSSNHLPNGGNVLRFYTDKDDKIVKCDYIENINGIVHKEIKLSYEELRNLFRKYIRNQELYYEQKIYDKFILFKFYDVDINEINRLIRNSKNNQKRDFNKFTPSNVKKRKTKNRKVARKNKFDGKKVMATIGAIAILLTSTAIFIKTSSEDIYKNNDPDFNDVVITTVNNDYNVQETLPQYIEVIEAKPKLQYDQYIEVDSEDCTSYKKYLYAKENYYDLILKYSKMYGIDPQIALAIACHERGVHSNEIDSGGGLGLFQIQVLGKFNWDGQNVYAYNFETKSFDTCTIKKEEIADIENNIKAGLMIFQECLIRNNYDIAKSIQEYNYGHGNMQVVLDLCYNNSEIKENNLDWLQYRNVINGGDPNYLENVLKYVEDNSVFEFQTQDGRTITCKYTISQKNNSMKK